VLPGLRVRISSLADVPPTLLTSMASMGIDSYPPIILINKHLQTILSKLFVIGSKFYMELSEGSGEYISI
jgi:hypothetical protein